MCENQKECQDCGWRGMASELDQNDEGSGSQTHIFCPDCGGMEIKDLNPDAKEEAPET